VAGEHLTSCRGGHLGGKGKGRGSPNISKGGVFGGRNRRVEELNIQHEFAGR